MRNCARVRSLDSRPWMTPLASLQMPGEESKAARPGNIGAGLVVTCPFVAVKAVLRAGIEVDLHIAPLGANDLDVAERDTRILVAEVKLGRHFRPVVGETGDCATIIAD